MPITLQHLEESVHNVTPAGSKPKLPPRPSRRPTCPPTEGAPSTCIWCGRAVHPSRRHYPASNSTCHGCGKRRHWQQLCKASSTNVVSDVEQNSPVSLNPLTSSHMMYSKSGLHQRVSLLTLTLALLLPNHHLPNTSNSRLTRDAPVILHMSQI